MADDVFSRNRPLFIIGGIVALAIVASIGFYAGRQNATLAPIVQAGRGAQGQRLTRLPPQHFDSWTLQCLEGPRGGKRCSLSLTAVDKSRKHILLRLSVLRGRRGPVLVALTPPNALLSAGLTLTPDKQQAVVAPFSRCAPQACEAITLLSDAVVKNLSAADKAHVRFVAAAGRPIEFEVPTTGFADGYATWQKTDTTPVQAATQSPPAAPANPSPSIDATPSSQAQKPADGN